MNTIFSKWDKLVNHFSIRHTPVACIGTINLIIGLKNNITIKYWIWPIFNYTIEKMIEFTFLVFSVLNVSFWDEIKKINQKFQFWIIFERAGFLNTLVINELNVLDSKFPLCYLNFKIQLATMRKLLLLGILCAGMFSCSKEDSNSGVTGNPNVNSFGEMHINPNFDWETSHNILLKVDGLSSGPSVKHFLVVTDPSGQEIYRTLTAVTSSHHLSIPLADQYKEVVVSFGSISKSVEVKNRRASFDYAKADDRSDLAPADR